MMLVLRPAAQGLYRLAELLDDGTEHGDYRTGLSVFAKYDHEGLTYWMCSTASQWVWFCTRPDGRIAGAVPQQSRDGSTFPPKAWLDRARDRDARVEWSCAQAAGARGRGEEVWR